MKKVVLILGLLFLAGCTGSDWARGFQGAGQGLNNAYQMDYQMKQQNQTVVYPNNSNNNSTYWQEQNARQQYFDRNMPKPTYSH